MLEKYSDKKISVESYRQIFKKKSKYHNKITQVDGIKFSSIKESQYYIVLKDMVKKGEIIRFHRQVIFDLPACKYVCDFMLIFPDGHVEYHEVKGGDGKKNIFMTPVGKLKLKQCEEIYKIEIKII